MVSFEAPSGNLRRLVKGNRKYYNYEVTIHKFIVCSELYKKIQNAEIYWLQI